MYSPYRQRSVAARVSTTIAKAIEVDFLKLAQNAPAMAVQCTASLAFESLSEVSILFISVYLRAFPDL